jgi:hypothetical protein
MTDSVEKVAVEAGEALRMPFWQPNSAPVLRCPLEERHLRGRPTLDGRWTPRLLKQRMRPACSWAAARYGSQAS